MKCWRNILTGAAACAVMLAAGAAASAQQGYYGSDPYHRYWYQRDGRYDNDCYYDRDDCYDDRYRYRGYYRDRNHYNGYGYYERGGRIVARRYFRTYDGDLINVVEAYYPGRRGSDLICTVNARSGYASRRELEWAAREACSPRARVRYY